MGMLGIALHGCSNHPPSLAKATLGLIILLLVTHASYTITSMPSGNFKIYCIITIKNTFIAVSLSRIHIHTKLKLRATYKGYCRISQKPLFQEAQEVK